MTVSLFMQLFYCKKKVKHAMPLRDVGRILIFLSMATEPVGGQTIEFVTMASVMPDLPSHGASSPFDPWYQIILLGEQRNMYVYNLPKVVT